MFRDSFDNNLVNPSPVPATQGELPLPSDTRTSKDNDSIEVKESNDVEPSIDLTKESLVVLNPRPQWTPPIRGPWLQSGGSTSQTICWDTTVPWPSEILLGTDPQQLQQVYFDGAAKTQHRVELVGLLPNTQYFYKITNGAQHNLAEHNFHSAPDINHTGSVRAIVFGDSGRTGNIQQSIIASAKHFEPAIRTNLLVFLGDMAYENGTDAEFSSSFYRPYHELLSTISSITTPGNHEEFTSSSKLCQGPYYDMAQPPCFGELGGRPSRSAAYYSMDIGPIHFISINTTDSVRLDLQQLDWIQDDLANSNAPWKVAIFHHPPYSHGNRNSDKYSDQTEVRQQIVPLLEKGGVDVVLSGHSHTCEISYLLRGHHGPSSTFNESFVTQAPTINGNNLSYSVSAGNPDRGVLYIVAGSSSRIDGATKHPAMAWLSSAPASLVVDASSDRFSARFVDQWGDVTQEVTIDKQP